jgi:hypothetical protein
LAEQELQRAATVTTLDVRWNRRVERALGTVRGALGDDAATSLLARFPSATLSGQGIGTSQAIARVAGFQEIVTRSLEIAGRGTLVVVVFDELRESLDGSPLRFLTSVVDIETAVVLMRVETARGREAVLDGMASAVVDSDVLRAVEDGLDGLSAKLSPMNRRRLRGVLAKLSEEPTDWLAISDSLTLGVEAAFRSGAEKEGLAVRRPIRGKNTQYLMVGSRPRPLSGIEMLFEHVGLNDERVAFLKRLAFGGPGNVFRHGGPGHGDEDEGDYRRQAVAMVLAFVLWFEAHGDRRPLEALASAVEVRRYSFRRLLVPAAE